MTKWFKILGSLMIAALLATVFVGAAFAQGPIEDGDGVRNLDGTGFGRGRGGHGQGAGDGSGERQYPNAKPAPEEWTEYEGIVTQVQESGVDMIIETADGQEIKIGTGPMYMEAQGFILQVGDAVQVRGYWQDDEFKAAEITRLADGETITLRDELGHPAWAGAGRNASNRGRSADGECDGECDGEHAAESNGQSKGRSAGRGRRAVGQ